MDPDDTYTAGRTLRRARALVKLAASGCLVAIALALSSGLTLAAHAESPKVKVGSWVSTAWCPSDQDFGAVASIHGVYDIDSVVRDSMPGEIYVGWDYDSLRANAIAARGFVYWQFLHKESAWICNTSGYEFHLSTYQMNGWNPALMVATVNTPYYPSNRVTDTMLQIMTYPGESHTPFAYFWMDTHQIGLHDAPGGVLDKLRSVYGSDKVLWTLDVVDGTVHIMPPFPSMTNGTHVGAFPWDPVPGDYWSGAVTPVNTSHEAEVYWGLKHVDTAQDSPFGQPGRYMVSAHMGDMIEFPMEIGGFYSQLHLIGIADRPAPVTVNVFVDGYWKTQASWTAGINLRAILTIPVPGVSFGDHAVAVQFTNDSWDGGGGGDDGDRNFYLDTLGVSQ
ncbi:MAG: hypothetical protein ACYC5O_24285 [Anaerolineae bacterium]